MVLGHIRSASFGLCSMRAHDASKFQSSVTSWSSSIRKVGTCASSTRTLREVVHARSYR
jgi:hypothetical protein